MKTDYCGANSGSALDIPVCYAKRCLNVLVVASCQKLTNVPSHRVSRLVFGKVAQFGTEFQTERLMMRQARFSSEFLARFLTRIRLWLRDEIPGEFPDEDPTQPGILQSMPDPGW